MLVEELQKLERTAKNHERIDAAEPYLVPEAMAIGDAIPQGDIAIEKISEQLNIDCCSEIKWSSGPYQLAPGTSKGSRHCIPEKFKDSVKIYNTVSWWFDQNIYIKATAPFDVVHPEHADHIGYPPGCYRVHHQLNAAGMRMLD